MTRYLSLLLLVVPSWFLLPTISAFQRTTIAPTAAAAAGASVFGSVSCPLVVPAAARTKAEQPQGWIIQALTNKHNSEPAAAAVEVLRQNWINQSVKYYSKVMREERRRSLGQVGAEDFDSPAYQDRFMALAVRHYFALRKIKDGKPRHAELIYRRIIDNLLLHDHDDNKEDDHGGECDHAKLAVTTLLLALHLQRTGASAKQTRSVFLTFFRVVALADKDDHDNSTDGHHHHRECACSAKVIGAFALFEMKQGNTLKSLQLARKAFELDPTVMQPLLNWKQFRDAANQQQVHRQQQRLKQNTQPNEQQQQPQQQL